MTKIYAIESGRLGSGAADTINGVFAGTWNMARINMLKFLNDDCIFVAQENAAEIDVEDFTAPRVADAIAGAFARMGDEACDLVTIECQPWGRFYRVRRIEACLRADHMIAVGGAAVILAGIETAPDDPSRPTGLVAEGVYADESDIIPPHRPFTTIPVTFGDIRSMPPMV